MGRASPSKPLTEELWLTTLSLRKQKFLRKTASSTLLTRCFCQNKADLMHLLTGATGYVGGRLLGRLQREGLPVRCLCRNPEAMRWRVTSGVELVQGDLHQPESLRQTFS